MKKIIPLALIVLSGILPMHSASAVSEDAKIVRNYVMKEIKMLNEGLKNKADDEPAFMTAARYSSLGLCYARIEEWDLAFENYSKAIELNEKDWHSYSGRGDVYIRRKDYVSALKDFTKAIELKPSNLNMSSYSGRADCYLHLNQFNLAIADCETLIKFEPKSPYGYCARARVYLAMNDLEKALADANEAVNLFNGGNGYVYRLRAQVYEKLGDQNSMEQDLKKADTLDKEDLDRTRKIARRH